MLFTLACLESERNENKKQRRLCLECTSIYIGGEELSYKENTRNTSLTFSTSLLPPTCTRLLPMTQVETDDGIYVVERILKHRKKHSQAVNFICSAINDLFAKNDYLSPRIGTKISYPMARLFLR